MLQKATYNQYTASSQINIDALNARYEHLCILDSNASVNRSEYLEHGRIIAIGAASVFSADATSGSLDALQGYVNTHKSWLFGYLSYDVKNNIEALSSDNPDWLHFPAIQFFVPRIVMRQSETGSEVFFDADQISSGEAGQIVALCFSDSNAVKAVYPAPEINARIRRENYLDAIAKLKSHIKKGDLYELNFCQEFFAENATIDPGQVYEKLNRISAAPFSVYGKFARHYLLCASPERFLKKTGNRLISQPIKGTTKRSPNAQEDESLKKELSENIKERSENVMIVDLVRNDLSRIAKKGTVNADELFGIYSFKQVHQMISTIGCQIDEKISFTEIIRALFPMGSMTGAPKISAMKLIEEYESTKRGLYSGAVGYISPDGDFDFNVVIRSILYNSENKYLSFMAGSAITDKSVPESEYEECLLKAKAMFEVLQNTDL